MKLNLDCVRDIMLAVEEAPLNQIITLKYLSEKTKHNADDVYYSCMKLSETGYLKIKTVIFSGHAQPQIADINELTYRGHNSLDSIRSNSVWDKVKETIKARGLASSIEVIGEIAIALAKGKLGL